MLLEKIKFLSKSETVLVNTRLKIISLSVEKTYSLFIGALKSKPNKQNLFVIGKTEYGAVKIPISKEIHTNLQNNFNIGDKVPVTLKIGKIKTKRDSENKIIAGRVVISKKIKKV